jgi:hypothetical protein
MEFSLVLGRLKCKNESVNPNGVINELVRLGDACGGGKRRLLVCKREGCEILLAYRCTSKAVE